MHSIRPRPICRARNTFSPAIALWQHFVAPNQHLAGRPLKSSFATEAARTSNDENERPSHQDLSADDKSIAIRQPGGRSVKRSNRTPGSLQKRDAGVRRFGRIADPPIRMMRHHNQAVSRHVEGQLKAAYDAYDASKDYEGVDIQALDLHVGVKDYELPWNTAEYKDLRPDEK